tara:strand:+ start:1533 stop:1739 length:207 start_codon:yes stop_codon:yes gene_type:complete
MDKYLNGKLVTLTSEEETEHNSLMSEAAAFEKTFDDAKATKATNKISGKTKLKSLGLSDDEITALLGD